MVEFVQFVVESFLLIDVADLTEEFFGRIRSESSGGELRKQELRHRKGCHSRTCSTVIAVQLSVLDTLSEFRSISSLKLCNVV